MSERDGTGSVEASWEALYNFRQHLDDTMEAAQESGRDLPELIHGLLGCIRERLGATAAGVHLQADASDPFSAATILVEGREGFTPATESGWEDQGDLRVYTGALDVGDEVLGTLSVAFAGEQPLAGEWIERYTEAFVEQVDNLVYQLRAQSRQHRLSVHVQLCLETPVFEDGLDEAVRLLVQHLPITRVLFLYRNDHFLYPERIAYRLYGPSGEVQAEELAKPDAALAKVLAVNRLGELSTELLPPHLREEGRPPHHMPLIHAGRHQVVMARLFLWLEPGAPVTATMAQAEILRSCVIQRLADYSKETRTLEKYFPPGAVLRLLRSPGYEEKYLLPRVEPLGVIFIDVAGFTRLSETALADPRDTGRFIDLWSEGATRILMEHGGVMDKLIGDCVMGLFGPPFFERSPAELASDVTRSALEIREFTQKLIDDPALAELREALLEVGGLDVSTGVNLTPCSVGLYGPNRDYTAFGSGVNNTARIQSVAKPGQTLALQPIVEALAGQDELSQGLRFRERGEVKVKNVAEPLVYYDVVRASDG